MALFLCQDFCPGNIPVRRSHANTTPIQFVVELLDRKSSPLLAAASRLRAVSTLSSIGML